MKISSPVKLIFLDFDGVLNSRLFYLRQMQISGNPFQSGNVKKRIDTDSIEFLNSLCQATGAHVVVTSSWRLGRTVDELQKILDDHGFKHRVVGKTEDLRSGPGQDSILRGNEILHWIKSNTNYIGCEYHEYKNYVILDDDSDMLYWQRNNFLLIDSYCGITPSTIFKAEKILGVK